LAHIKSGAAEEAEALWREHLDARNKQWQKRLGANRVVDVLNH
jgi:hypothetical protein